MKKTALLVILLALALCGCNYKINVAPEGNTTITATATTTTASVEEAIRGIPEVKTLLYANKDANLAIDFVDSASFEKDKAAIEKACKRTMPLQGYYKVGITSASFNGTMWISEDNYEILCGIKNVVITVAVNSSATPVAQLPSQPSIMATVAADACTPSCNDACQFCGSGKCLYKAGLDCCSDLDCTGNAYCAGYVCTTPTPTPSPSPTPEPTPTPIEAATQTPEPSLIPTPEPSPTPEDDSWRPHYG